MHSPIVVLVADDLPMDRAALVDAVLAAHPAAQIIEANSGRQAVRLMKCEPRPQLAIFDRGMSPMTGDAAAAAAHRMGIEAHVVSACVPFSKAHRGDTTDKRDAPWAIARWIRGVLESQAAAHRRQLPWWRRLALR